MESRNCHDVVQQYIDSQSLAHYIDDLKSRICKAFFEKSRSQACRLQSRSVTSALVVSIAISYCTKSGGWQPNLFELGYLSLCLSNNFYLDTSPYCYYRESLAVDTIYLFDPLIKKAKCLILIWCIEPYYNYLLSKVNLPFDQLNYAQSLNRFISSKLVGAKYALYLNLAPYLDSLYLSALIKRSSLGQDVRLYLAKLLSHGIFDCLISYLNLSLDYVVFLKNSQTAFRKLLGVFISFICGEINIMFNVLNVAIDSVQVIAFMHFNPAVLILCQDYLKLNIVLRKLSHFSLFNLRSASFSPVYLPYLLAGVNCSLFSMTLCNTVYPFYFAIRPSLYSQLVLMRRVSFALRQSVSRPLFLLIIRLNKLLFFWAHTCFSDRAGKIFYLADYLIFLKLRLFAKKQGIFLRNLSTVLHVKRQYGNGLSCVLGKFDNMMFAYISNNNFYRCYASIRIFWIYTVKMLIELREAA